MDINIFGFALTQRSRLLSVAQKLAYQPYSQEFEPYLVALHTLAKRYTSTDYTNPEHGLWVGHEFVDSSSHPPIGSDVRQTLPELCLRSAEGVIQHRSDQSCSTLDNATVLRTGVRKIKSVMY